MVASLNARIRQQGAPPGPNWKIGVVYLGSCLEPSEGVAIAEPSASIKTLQCNTERVLCWAMKKHM